MPEDPQIVFVCEHGAAKSVVAAAYFNKLAGERGLNLRAIARGTNPDNELSAQTIKGLLEDGLTPTESTPQKLTKVEIQTAQWIITFCELRIDGAQAIVEFWGDVPPVSENYEKARTAILERVYHLVNKIESP